MRKVGKEGRAIVKSFSYPKGKDEFMEKLEETARREGLSFSEVMLEGLEKWWLEHGDSENPQTLITLYETGLENAIPNIYRSEESFRKFYNMITKRDEFKKLDAQINMILRIHNQRDKELGTI